VYVCAINRQPAQVGVGAAWVRCAVGAPWLPAWHISHGDVALYGQLWLQFLVPRHRRQFTVLHGKDSSPISSGHRRIC